MAEKNKDPAARNVEAITRDNQLNSPLLRLPAELRNRIYHFTFDTNEVVLGPRSLWDPPDFWAPRATPYPLGLAQTCTQCNYEALPYFWRTTVFRLRNLSESLEFTNQALLNQIQIIRIERGNVMPSVMRLSQSRYQVSYAALRRVLIWRRPDRNTSLLEGALKVKFGKDIEICFYTD
ncbi:hypothetical protein AA0117_g10939 [Alternaria alternata]|uniref:F-box domain-containing protein n=1 Tax=Alternaria alternata TaxID=5599 RepID=A0A4Q4N4N1_ALTAL|nr:hypothetical protein AA0117_g10939 [Alternaria alternata]